MRYLMFFNVYIRVNIHANHIVPASIKGVHPRDEVYTPKNTEDTSNQVKPHTNMVVESANTVRVDAQNLPLVNDPVSGSDSSTIGDNLP